MMVEDRLKLSPLEPKTAASPAAVNPEGQISAAVRFFQGLGATRAASGLLRMGGFPAGSGRFGWEVR